MTTLILVSLLILGFGLASERLHRSSLTPPMVFVGVGLALGSDLLDDVESTRGVLERLAELTLILVLFTDASRIRLKALTADYVLPLRLLSIGMPAAIILGTLGARWLLPDLSFWECVVLSTILAPTDAALGQAVVSAHEVPARIRQALNVESGLNDGIAFPLVLVFMALASTESGSAPESGWLVFTSLQILLGPALGAACGFVLGQLVERAAGAGNSRRNHLGLAGAAAARPLARRPTLLHLWGVHGKGHAVRMVVGDVRVRRDQPGRRRGRHLGGKAADRCRVNVPK